MRDKSRVNFWTIVAIIGVVVMVPSIAVARTNIQRASNPIGVGNVLLDSGDYDDNGHTIRAFVPTGSDSDRCLLTLNEWNHQEAGISMVCSPRTTPAGVKGLVIAVYLPEDQPDVEIFMNVYQQGAIDPPFFDEAIPCASIPDEDGVC